MAGEKDLVVKTAFRDAKKSDEGIKADTYHEGNGAKLEFERSNGVFELMIELPHNTVEGGAAKVIGAGNVDGLQKKRSWNLSRPMCVPEVAVGVEWIRPQEERWENDQSFQESEKGRSVKLSCDSRCTRIQPKIWL